MKTSQPAKKKIEKIDTKIAKKMTAQYLREHRSLTVGYVEAASVDEEKLPVLGYVKNTEGGWDWQGIQPA